MASDFNGIYYIIAGIVVLGLVAWLAFIIANMAREKGYSYGGFWVLGFFLFIVGLTLVLCLPDKTNRQYCRQPYQPYGHPDQPPYQPPYQQQPAQGVCPNCGNSVAEDAPFCPKCGIKNKQE